MANPIRIFLVPSVGLSFECESSSGGTLQKFGPSGQDPIRYTLSNLQDEGFRKYLKKDKIDGGIKGWMSPIANITLPPKIKNKIGIQEKVKYFAYIHPPEGLADIINWEEVDKEVASRHDSHIIDLSEKNRWAMPFCSVLGAYAYFTDDSLVQVNSLSLLKTNFNLDLAGPFKVPIEAQTEMRELKRVHPLTSEVFHEMSYVAFGAICPGEVFRSKAVFEMNMKGSNGAFMFYFYRDDGNAICYEVDTSGFFDPTGMNSSLRDVVDSLTLQSKGTLKKSGFISNYRLPELGSEENLRKRIKRAYSRKADTPLKGLSSQASSEIDSLLKEFPKTLLHEACRARCDKETFEKVVNDVGTSMLKNEDEIGWLPLHYACRHYCHDKDGKSDFELIELLVQWYPGAVTKKDKFNRCPLHIAIDSRASVDVVDLLLNHDESQIAINCTTATLKRNPFHIACNRGASKDVFERLMRSDSKGEMLISKTLLGCTPLQLAIESRLQHDIIRMLIARSDHMVDKGDGVEVVLNFDDKKLCTSTIHTRFNGMVPLAQAVWNKSSPETIAVLLEYDTENSTIDEEVLKEEANATSQTAMQDLSGMIPLHLALKHSDSKVVALLLQKEKMKTRSNRYESTIFKRDKKQRLPLHIATQSFTDLSIVEELLAIDVKKETTRALDSEWCTPLHYACDRIDNAGKLVALLLKSEQRYLSILKAEEGTIPQLKDWAPSDFPQGTSNSPSYESLFLWPFKNTARCLDKTKKSPLFHAVKNDADGDTIAELLRPENFFLKKFESLVDELAGIIQKSGNKKLQGYLIDELSNRCYFCLMLFDITFHTIALGTFFYSSERLIEGKISYGEIIVLWICIGFGVMRELARFRSQHSSYFLDFCKLHIICLRSFLCHHDDIYLTYYKFYEGSWSEVTCLILLGYANVHFINSVDVDAEDLQIDRPVLTAAGAFLVVNLVFFLRTTFLPFARFVGGLIIILQTLIPFFIVSFLLLLAFAYSFRMSGSRGDTCESLTACYYSVMQAFFAGAEGVEDYLDVLYGIIIIVVLLNVVIAIVEQAWSNAADVTMRLFWTYRLEFLAENRIFAKSNQWSFLRGIEKRIDEVRDVVYSDRTSWSKAPYNLVDSKAKYENPGGYFPPDIAEIIKGTFSCQSSLYWVKHEDSEQKNNVQLFWGQFAVLFNFFCRFLVYSLLTILGTLTCGWFWPRNLRKKILSVGLSEVKED